MSGDGSVSHSAASLREALGLPASTVRAAVEATGTALHVTVPEGDRLTVDMYGDADGALLMTGSGDGHAIRYGFGDGDAIRSGSGNGGASREDDGNGRAIRDSSGHGGGGVIVLRLPTLVGVLAVPFTLTLFLAIIALVSWGLAEFVLRLPTLVENDLVAALAGGVSGAALAVLFWLAFIAFITWALQRLLYAAFMFCMWWMDRPSKAGGS